MYIGGVYISVDSHHWQQLSQVGRSSKEENEHFTDHEHGSSATKSATGDNIAREGVLTSSGVISATPLCGVVCVTGGGSNNKKAPATTAMESQVGKRRAGFFSMAKSASKKFLLRK